jgi:hypothetical protein
MMVLYVCFSYFPHVLLYNINSMVESVHQVSYLHYRVTKAFRDWRATIFAEAVVEGSPMGLLDVTGIPWSNYGLHATFYSLLVKITFPQALTIYRTNLSSLNVWIAYSGALFQLQMWFLLRIV